MHLTLDLPGQAKFGRTLNGWTQSTTTSIPAERRLQPGYAGVRPKIARPGEYQQRVGVPQTEKEHGVAGLINLFGIEFAGADGEPGDRTGWRTTSDQHAGRDGYGESLVRPPGHNSAI